MKKKIVFILSLCLLLHFSLWCGSVIHAYDANKDTVTAFGATYKATRNARTADLGYGITHIKDIGESSATNLNNYESCGPKDELVPQVINILNIPSNEAVRVVNWTYLTTDGWTKQSVTKLAENFELYNPGWKVIAGVNGDFFDINGNGALPYQTTGFNVSNGEVYRPYGNTGTSDVAIGFKNDGSNYPFVGGKLCEAGPLKLQVLDNNGNVLHEFDVQKKNESPSENEVAVWFTYPINTATGKENVTMTTPATNSYIVKTPIRCLAMSKTQVYGKGYISAVNEEIALNLGQFAIETTNQEVAAHLENGSFIRVQQNIIGDYADCDNILGSGAKLVENGEAFEETGGMSYDRHPRTCIGVKKDGTIVLMTVDGRQFAKGMYGMSYAELSSTLLYYDCNEAYNVDGGGSTTMIIRNAYGGFETMNSPSDGNERRDSNAVLVVVPEISMSLDSIDDTSISLSYQPTSAVAITDLKLTMNGITKEMTENEFIWNDLVPETAYTLSYAYNISYKNTTLTNMTGSIQFTTGKIKPSISRYYYEETDTSYIFHFLLTDPQKTIRSAYIRYDNKTATILNTANTSLTLSKEKVKDPTTFQLCVDYDLKSSPNIIKRESYPIDLYQSYTITYHLNGGVQNSKNPTTYNSNTIPLTLFDPNRAGYQFLGWYTENEGGTKILTLSDFSNQNIELYAHWSLTTYTINYELNGGINSVQNPNQYTIQDLPISLYTPTKKGFLFKGWKYNGEFVTSLPTGQVSNITLEACWEPAKKCGNCGCKKDISILFTLTSALTLGCLILRKKH